jgi:Tfp pilus assembly protein PilF
MLLRASAVLLLTVWSAPSKTTTFRLKGEISPPARSYVALYGATTPYSRTAPTDFRGQFEFKKLPAGTYTVSIYVRNRGELRRTVEVGPGTADPKGQVTVRFRLDERLMDREAAKRAHLVNIRELSVSDKARKAYWDAQKRLGKRDVAGALAKLNEAVKISPQFVAAWNYIGTIHYQTKNYPEAEKAFRTALQHDPEAHSPMVNLGGVLLNLRRPKEALPYNKKAAETRPQDALANAQLGMNYLMLDQQDLGKKYLLAAKKLDPAHFSHPQMLLAEIYLREGNRAAAASELEEFLRLHPDYAARDKVQTAIQKLRSR